MTHTPLNRPLTKSKVESTKSKEDCEWTVGLRIPQRTRPRVYFRPSTFDFRLGDTMSGIPYRTSLRVLGRLLNGDKARMATICEVDDGFLLYYCAHGDPR